MPEATLIQYRNQNNLFIGTAIPLPIVDMDFLIQEPFVSDRPLTAHYPRPEEVIQTTRHAFNTTYPGANYQCLVQASGGSPPYKYELLSGPGTIGEFLTEDVNGDLKPGTNYSVITAPSIAGGGFNVVVRATDQAGDFVVWQWILRSELALNFFVSTANVGTGSGADEANARSLATTYLGATTNSPAKGKVVRLLTGTHTGMTAMQLSADYNPVSWCAIPGQLPVFKAKVTTNSDDVYLEGVEFNQVGTSSFGVFNWSGGSNRTAAWRVKFNSCFNIAPLSTENQCCIGANLLDQGGESRSYVTVVDCEFKNSIEIHAFTLFSIQSMVIERNRYVYDNPEITSLSKSDIFTKSTCYNVQIAYNVWDNPHLTGTSDGIIQLYNAYAVNAQPVSIVDCFYNTFRCDPATGNLVTSNFADNQTFPAVGSVLITNRFERNSVSGTVDSRNTDREFNVEKQSFYRKNAVQNRKGGITVQATPTNDPIWFIKEGAECEGVTGVFDSEMKLTGASAAFVGTRGDQLRRVV